MVIWSRIEVGWAEGVNQPKKRGLFDVEHFGSATSGNLAEPVQADDKNLLTASLDLLI